MVDVWVKNTLCLMIAIAMSAGVTVAIGEWVWLRQRGGLTPAVKNNIRLSLSAIPPNIVMIWAMSPVWLAVYTAIDPYALTHQPIGLTSLVLALLAADLCYYTEHRCAHSFRPLWTLYHSFHHSGHHFNIATAYRVSFISQLVAPVFYLPMVVLGFDPLLTVGMQLFVFHYQAWLHTEIVGPLGAFEACMNSPRNHRMHHSSATIHRNKNMGAITMFWDRLFGTYQTPQLPVNYGITHCPEPGSWLALYTDHWRRR